MAQRAIPLRVLVPTPISVPLSRTPGPATGAKKKKGGSVGALFRNVLGDQQLAVALVKSPLQYIIADAKTRKIFLFLLLSTAFMVVEFVYGFHSNSLGLVSDACHMLFDCAALAIGLYASYTAKFQANAKFNYGYGRFEVISGYMNAIFLILVASLIVLESLERILDPPQIATDSLLVVSIGGFVVNVVGLVFFHDHHHHGHSHGHPHSKKDDTLKAKGGDYKVLDVEDHAHSHSHNHNHDHTHGHHHDHEHGDHHDHEHGDHHDHAHGHHHDHEHGDHHDHEHGDHHDHEHGDHHDHAHGHHHDHAHGHHHDHAHGHHHDHAHGHHHDHNHSSSCNHGHHHDHEHEHGHGHDHSHGHGHGHGEVEHDHTDHNMQGMFLHILADTLGSIGVVVSTLLIQYKGWYLADPACSIFISGLIVASVIPLVKGPAEILLQRMPRGTEKRIQHSMKQVEALDGVWSCQALHVWNFTSADTVGSLHVLATRGADRDRLRVAVAEILKKAGITDLTLQVETV